MSNIYSDYVGFSDPLVDRSILHDSRGVRMTQMLFVDVNLNKKATPIYTMRDHDYKGCISAYQIYMHAVDEYEAALKLVGSIDHWDKLCGLKWFMEGDPARSFTGVIQWREDMKRRDSMLAKRVLMYNARTGKDTSAARALLQMHKEPAKTASEKKKEEAKAAKSKVQKEKSAKVSNILDKLKQQR